MGSPRPSNTELRWRKVAIGSNSLKVESRKVEGRKSQGRRSKVARSKVKSRKVEGQKSQGRSANVMISKFTKVKILETMGENCILCFRSYLSFNIHIDTTIDKGDNKKCNNKEKGPSSKEQTKRDTSVVGVA